MPNPEEIMKYICFGYQNEKKWEQMSESEKNALFDACFAYDDEMRAKGHWLSGEAIEDASAAVSVRMENGKILEVLTPEQQQEVRKRIAAWRAAAGKTQYPMRRPQDQSKQ